MANTWSFFFQLRATEGGEYPKIIRIEADEIDDQTNEHVLILKNDDQVIGRVVASDVSAWWKIK